MKTLKKIVLLLAFASIVSVYAEEQLSAQEAWIEEIRQCGDKIAKADWNGYAAMVALTAVGALGVATLEQRMETSLAASWLKYLSFWSGVTVAALVGIVKGGHFFLSTAAQLRATYKDKYTAYDYKLIEYRAAYKSIILAENTSAAILAACIIGVPLAFMAAVAQGQGPFPAPDLKFI